MTLKCDRKISWHTTTAEFKSQHRSSLDFGWMYTVCSIVTAQRREWWWWKREYFLKLWLHSVLASTRCLLPAPWMCFFLKEFAGVAERGAAWDCQAKAEPWGAGQGQSGEQRLGHRLRTQPSAVTVLRVQHFLLPQGVQDEIQVPAHRPQPSTAASQLPLPKPTNGSNATSHVPKGINLRACNSKHWVDLFSLEWTHSWLIFIA